MSETPEPPVEPNNEQPDKSERAPDLQVRGGLLKLEDVPADQRNEAVANYLSQVNAKFEERDQPVDPKAVRNLILKQYGELGLDDLKDIASHTDDIVALAGKPADSEAETASDIETAAASATETASDPDQPTEALEADPARQARLKEFVATHFADVCPAKYYDEAAGVCVQYEDDYRDMFGEPELELGAEDASDPDIRATITDEVEKLQQEIQNNQDADANTETLTEQAIEITAIESENQAVEGEADQAATEAAVAATQLEAKQTELADTQAQLAREQVRKTDLRAEQSEAQATQDRLIKQKDGAEDRNNQLEDTADRKDAEEAATAKDLKTVEELQSKFDSLKAEKGTIGALKSLLGPKGVKTPKMRAIVQRVLGTAQRLVSALPGKSAVIERYINQSNVNLSASSPQAVFAGFLALADSSDELTEEERETIRRVLGQSEKDFNSGSDAIKIAQAKEQIIDPETGEVIGERYLYDSPDNMAELRPNLGTYMKGERMMLATTDGSVSKDVTGWAAEDVGLLAEALELHSFAEQAGITGMVESIGNIHFNVLHDGAFDRSKIIDVRQVVSALVGQGEGYDGDVFDPRQKGLLMKAQMRVLTDNDEAFAWNNDEAATTKIIEDLGLKTKGKPNLEVVQAFGAYIQDNMSATREDTHQHLYKLFPDLVSPPEQKRQVA